MDENAFLAVARQLMHLPTAPFHEHLVIAAVERFAAAASPAVDLRRDPAGNLLLRYTPPGAPRRPRLIATAHLDHPGLGFPRPLGRGAYFFEKLGGVDLGQALGARVRLYHLGGSADQRPQQGRIEEHRARGGVEGFVVRLEQGAQVGAGCFGMWDLPPLRRRGRLLWGRACDDLAGVAVGLCFLGELARRRAQVRAGLLLTRAEEVGFAGMLEAAHAGWLDQRALYLNLECSSARAGAAMGGGPIVRVGDRACLFDPRLHGGMALLAGELAAADPAFRFQRKLMDGGTCETSALQQAGYHAGALALPLGNYHNRGARGLAAEFVHLGDAAGLVRLLVHLALAPEGLARAGDRALTRLEGDMEARRRRHGPRLRETFSARLEPIRGPALLAC